MHKIITFLGKYPKETTYQHEGQVYTGRVFAEAMHQFFDFDEMLVFTTAEAAETTWPVLEALDDSRIRAIPIPIGRDEDELWDIFDCLTQKVIEGDSVIFDITHGLRSIPFLVFLAAAYLKEARNVTVEKIVYGAYELGQPAPVIDLSKFAPLLDWLTATDRFVETGDGRPLANLLRAAGRFEHPQRKLTPQEQATSDACGRIRQAASAIEETSRALLTTFIPQAERASHLLAIRLAEAESDLAQQAPPYRVLAERVRTTYAPFALEAPMSDALETDLLAQLEMIGWYLDNGHIPQAITLMREWVVTAVGRWLGLGAEQLLDYHTGRRPVGEALNWLVHHQPTDIDLDARLDEPPYVLELQSVPHARELALLWDQLTQVRNPINHAMMKKNWSEIKSETIVSQIRECYGRLCRLAPSLMEETQ